MSSDRGGRTLVIVYSNIQNRIYISPYIINFSVSQFIKHDTHTLFLATCATMGLYVSLNSFVFDLLSSLLKEYICLLK